MTASILWFALEIVAAVRVRDPRPGGEGAIVRTIGWTLATRDGDAMTLRSCAVRTTPVLGTRTTYSAAFVAASPVVEAQVRGEDGRFAAGPWITEIGAEDADGDGNPGVTVDVSHVLLGRGRVFVTHRSITSLEGVVSADGRIAGRASVEATPTVLDATTWWLRLSTRPKPDPENSRFRMVPIGEPTCGAVARALAAD